MNAPVTTGLGYRPIDLGRHFGGELVDLDVTKLNNFGCLFVGESGTGKTWSIRQLTRAYLDRQVTPFVIDSQGDMTPEAFGVPEEMCVVHDIEYGPNGISLNPFRLDLANGEGAFYLAVEDAIEAFRIWRNERALGDQQEATLRKLFVMTYENNGILPEDPETWKNRIPTWDDFLRTIGKVLGLITLQSDTEKLKDSDITSEDLIQQTCEKLKAMDTDISVVNRALTSDLNSKTVASIANLAYAMGQSGLFGGDDINLEVGKINIYRTKNLRIEGKKVVIRMLLDRLFSWAMRVSNLRGLNRPVPDVMIIIDEAKLASATAKNKLSSLSRIATEGRKFGLGLICGVQHLGQLDGEVLKSTATKFVLRVESSMVNDLLRTFNIKKPLYDAIQPRSDALVQINGGDFQPIHLWRD